MARADQQLTRIADVQKKYADTLLKKRHVVGLSVGPMRQNGKATGEFALVVLVDEKPPTDSPDAEDAIPSTLDGVPVVVHEVGVLEAL